MACTTWWVVQPFSNDFFSTKFFISPASTKLKGRYIGFTLSVRLSACPSVSPSVDRIMSALYLLLVGSISYLHILSSNFRRCVMCKVCFKIQKFVILANSLNLWLWLCLLLTWDPIWLNSMVIMRQRGYPQNAGVLVALVVFWFKFQWTLFLWVKLTTSQYWFR